MLDTIVLVVVVLLVAFLLAAPLTEAFTTFEEALADRFGNRGRQDRFDASYKGGWLPNGFPSLDLESK